MREGIRSALGAVAFLTAVPVGRGAEISRHRPEAGALLFPVVGALAGASMATAAWTASLAFPPVVAGVIGVATGVLITAALHLDGLADVADGVGASLSGSDPMRAMRDPRLGVFGGAALVLDLSLRISVVSSLLAGGAFPGDAVAAGAISRVAPLALAVAIPYVGPRHTWTRRVGIPTLVGASTIAATVGVLTAGATFAAMVLVSAAVSGVVGRWSAARLGGTTGDVLGAVVELSETLSLAVALAAR